MAGLDSYSYGNIIQTSSRLKLDLCDQNNLQINQR